MANQHFTFFNFLKTTYHYEEKSFLHRWSDWALWPYRALRGHYQIDLSKNKDITVSKWKTNSTKLRVLAWLLSPLALIIGLPLRYLTYYLSSTLRHNDQQIGEEFDRLKQETVDLKAAITKEVLELTGEAPTMDEFNDLEADISIQYRALLERLTSPNEWNSADFKHDFKDAFAQARQLMLPYFLLVEESTKETNKTSDVTPESFAQEIVKQPLSDGKPWSYLFFSYFMDLYYIARTRDSVYRSEELELCWSRHDSARRKDPKYALREKRSEAPEFYQLGTDEYKWRKTYNTMYKSFYQRYGGSKFQEALRREDQRFVRWTPTDSSGNEVFRRTPDTRPT